MENDQPNDCSKPTHVSGFGRIRRYTHDLLLISETVGALPRIAILAEWDVDPNTASQFTFSSRIFALRRESESVTRKD